ncbi:MAG: AraC family transcriptional regulator [Spirochaetes bacterium]|nr:AraC family transcriptional regulator [Spirochaetota bacterium]
MAEKKVTQPRGVLHLKKGRQKFKLDRRLPPDDLATTVEHFWAVEWDLTGFPPYPSETLPHPSVHLVFDNGKTEVIGVMRGRFTKTLTGCGQAFGIKFRPGGFHAFCKAPLSQLTDRRFNPEKFFGESWHRFAAAMATAKGIDAKAECAVNFLRGENPTPDADALLVQEITHRILTDTTLNKVDTLVGIFPLSKRQLQRLFKVYIGVNPKWVIERYRMHEALERLEATQKPDFARLAHALGYYDQAHFIRAFRKMTGKLPGTYVSG